jgi:hypothetical protein
VFRPGRFNLLNHFLSMPKDMAAPEPATIVLSPFPMAMTFVRARDDVMFAVSDRDHFI